MHIYFEEKQRFRQWWLWLLLLGVSLIPLYGIYQQIFLHEQFGDNPMPDIGLIVLSLFMLSFVIFFWTLELRTHIDKETIKIQFFPITKKEIKWKDIAQAQVVNYGFVGGWGIKLSTKYGVVYNTSGKMGLALQLKNGKKICVGTQKAEELKRILKQAGKQQIITSS